MARYSSLQESSGSQQGVRLSSRRAPQKCVPTLFVLFYGLSVTLNSTFSLHSAGHACAWKPQGLAASRDCMAAAVYQRMNDRLDQLDCNKLNSAQNRQKQTN
jgi:hypothetical protein